MTLRGTRTFGLSNQPQSGRVPPPKPAPPKPVVLPKVLSYPRCWSLAQSTAHIKDRLCYVIRHYGKTGLSVLVVRDVKADKIAILCGDWDGNNIDLAADSTDPIVQAALVFVQEDVTIFLQTMNLIKLSQAQFFFALDKDAKLTLVDIQISLDKLAGPGFVRDFFGKVYRTQEVLKIEAIDERALEYIEKGTGTYEGNLIIKPSKFSMFSPTAEEKIVPLYTEIVRD